MQNTFMLHEQAIPKAGIPETLFLAVLGAAMVSVVLRYRSTIFAGPVALAVAAGAAFAVALAADLVMDQNFYLEDGFKFVGIWTWAGFLVMFSRQTILRDAEGAMSLQDDADRSPSDSMR
ncbi:MAG: hypothetical protein WD990_11285 [Acidimicrobiia bacterium]